ncbi:MAG: GNAT family protein [Candidatus Moranbacteria bacterium]|nr:GNAT family protein [Candidatus Moranbacteria bacterium]
MLEENYSLILNAFHDIDVVKYLSFAKQALALNDVNDLKDFIAEFEGESIFEIYDYDDKFIGYTFLSDFKEKEECEFGIFILDKNYWGKGIGSEVTRLMLEYAFNELNFEKVVLSTSEFSHAAINIYEKAGFNKIELLPEDRTIFHEDKWFLSGTILMEIKRADFIATL